MQRVPFKRVFALLAAAALLAVPAPPPAAAAAAVPPVAAERAAQAPAATAGQDAAVSPAGQPVVLAEGASAAWQWDLAAGDYRFDLRYRARPGKAVSPELTLLLTGGGVRYETSCTLSRVWRDERPGPRFATDEEGSELVPAVREEAAEQSATLSLIGGFQPVSLPAGRYTLTATMAAQSVEILSLAPSTKAAAPYGELHQPHPAGPGTGESLYLEAELPSAKSSTNLIPTFDTSSPDISPSAADRTLLGLIGGDNYNQEGQWLEYAFTVAAAGYYTLCIAYRQDAVRGLGVRRRITIDGQVPFAEAEDVVFPYTEGFRTLTLEADGQPCLIYLDAGEHTLRLEVTRGAMSGPLQRLQQVQRELGRLYRAITAVTGPAPDRYRDYNLHREIPGLIEDLTACAEQLEELAGAIDGLSSSRQGSETAVFTEAARVIRKMVERPHRMERLLSSLKSQIDTVAAQTMYLNTQPLQLDTLEWLPPETPSARRRSSFLDVIWYRLQVFVHSYARSYSHVTGEGGQAPLHVWISVSDLLVSGSSAGREQMQILDRLCREDFTPDTGIPVKFALVNTTDVLTQAIVSGKGPDVAHFVPEQPVINLAVRGALADMGAMDDYGTVAARFHPSALIPYRWRGGVYALPETQTYFMLFYRTDILRELGLTPPDTWQAFYRALQVLQEKGLQAGVPELGMSEQQRVFDMLLLQRGGQAYDDGLQRTALTTDAGIEAFTAWTDLYVKHSLPLSYDFLNRFRTGEMPLALANSVLYNQLEIGAPEIRGAWAMAPIPGTPADEGVNRAQAAVSNGCVIVQSSRRKEAAYRFARWWTSDRTQAAFGQDIESAFGASARYNTANLQAMQALNWSEAELAAFRETQRDLTDIPQTPATYYLNRNLLNAFRRVVYDYEAPRDVLTRYAGEVDRELARKREELGIAS